jgi:predicted RNase H-like HicB family nuclease
MKETLYYLGVVEKEEGTYSISFPNVNGCYSCGSSLDELYSMAKEALALHLDAMKDHNMLIPLPTFNCRSVLETKNACERILLYIPYEEGYEHPISFYERVKRFFYRRTG